MSTSHNPAPRARAAQEGLTVSRTGGDPDTVDLTTAPRPCLALPCRQHPADLWFAETPHDVEAAKALCAACPIREHCLAGALERAEPWGVWGGQLLLSGVVVARKRPRGRPRKNPVAA